MKKVEIMTLFPGKIAFKDVGRSKASFTVEIKNERSFWAAVKKHLMSNDLEYFFDPATNQGEISAGFRTVGTFSRVLTHYEGAEIYENRPDAGP